MTGLARLWAGARAANYLGPFFNTVISNVPGPRQTMYCVGAPATHDFPVSIPYHGCALNITAHSYLDQLDFGLIACSETVPDAQRIADFIVEDFAASATVQIPCTSISMPIRTGNAKRSYFTWPQIPRQEVQARSPHSSMVNLKRPP